MNVYKRTHNDETLYVAINNGSESQSVTVTGIDSGMQLNGLLGDNLVRETKEGEFKIGIPRETAEVYTVEEDTGINWLFIGFILSVMGVFIIAVIYLSRKQKKRSRHVLKGDCMNITVTQEIKADYNITEKIVKEAFAPLEFNNKTEHKLVARIRKSTAFIPKLSFVAID